MPTPLKTLILAIQFLTRLPTPAIHDFEPAMLARAALWFPVVGLLIGGILFTLSTLTANAPLLLSALVILVAWVWITGGLHLDGLADLSDALGAAHRSPERFLAVLKDPHLGSFGVMSLILQLLSKFVGVYLLLSLKAGHFFILIPAIARLGPLYWSKTLPPLGKGMGEQFAWQTGWSPLIGGMLVLAGTGACLQPWQLTGLLTLPVWQYFLRQKVGGVTGDCLGAGIEISETLQLLSTITLLTMHGIPNYAIGKI